MIFESLPLPNSAPPAPTFGDALPVNANPAVLDFLAIRRSTPAPTLRAPAPSRPELDDLLRLAARVPDHGKLAPWRFIILEGAGKTAFEARLDAVAAERPDAAQATAKLGKLKTPPMGVVVVSSPVTGAIPHWEQLLSAGAVCTNLLMAAAAMGYGANWITDWYAYDDRAKDVLGLRAGEEIAGYIFLGTAAEAPLERVRPDVASLTSVWSG